LSSTWLNPEETASALGYLERRFGIPPSALAGHRLVRKGEHVYAVRREAADVCETLDWVSAGLRVFRLSGSDRFKLSTPGAQVFGSAATARVHDLAGEELLALVEGRSIPSAWEPGPAILRYGGTPVGLGLVRGGQLVSQLPRSVTENLRLPDRAPRSHADRAGDGPLVPR